MKKIGEIGYHTQYIWLFSSNIGNCEAMILLFIMKNLYEVILHVIKSQHSEIHLI